jgi:HAD superfamily hydrolase (TIGR01549 family)
MTPGGKMTENGIDLSRLKGLLFDVDGTLSDTDDHMVDRLSRLLSPLSWMFPKRDPRGFARWLVMALETPANFLYGIPDTFGFDEPLARWYNRVARRRRAKRPTADRFQLIPGVKDMLTRLDADFPMAVVSARDAETTEEFLRHFDLLPHFETVVTAHTCEHTKPYPDPVQYAAEEIGLAPEACLMIGDTIVDVHAGRAAGAQTVAVLCGFGRERELKRAEADLILTTTADLIALLEHRGNPDRK